MTYKYTRMNIRVNSDVHTWLSDRAARSGLSLNSYMIMLIEKHIEQQEMLPHIPGMVEELQRKDK